MPRAVATAVGVCEQPDRRTPDCGDASQGCVATASGVCEQPGRSLSATLADSLVARKLLLVLDNCEHLIAACATLAETLLCACPDLHILATSREALQIGGEATYRVPSLSTRPEPGQWN